MDRRSFLKAAAAFGAMPSFARLATAEERANTVAPLNIPANTWIARRLPGPGKAPASGKDFRMAFNPADQQLYIGFGDWAGPWGLNSGRQEMYSYHVGRDQWTLVVPYCLGQGHIQPSGPDELGWVYDSKRAIFWMIPGFQWDKDCPSSVKGKVMTFEPRTRQWSVVEGIEPIHSDVVYSQYDERTDRIFSFAWDGGMGTAIDIIDCATATLKRQPLRGVGNARIAKNYSALDPQSRTLYGMDTRRGKFYAYDLDRGNLSAIGSTPFNPGKENQALMVFNTKHNVLLWPYKEKLYVYDPSRDRWQTRAPRQPEGIPVFGQSVGYDPQHDVLVYMGGYLRKNENLFLYRYEPD